MQLQQEATCTVEWPFALDKIKCRRIIIKSRLTPAPGTGPTPLMAALVADCTGQFGSLREAKAPRHSARRNYPGFVEPGMDPDDGPRDENSWTAGSA